MKSKETKKKSNLTAKYIGLFEWTLGFEADFLSSSILYIRVKPRQEKRERGG